MAAVVMVGLALAVFARGLRGPAVAVTVVDDAVVRWWVGVQTPRLERVWLGVAELTSWWLLFTLMVTLPVALIAMRRWRHLVVWLISWQLLLVVFVAVARTARRPRPFGVTVGSSWGGWALPSMQLSFFAALLVGLLYGLVPEGWWRNTGKWLAAVLVGLAAVARVALGTDAPTDVLLGLGIGVAIPLVAFRRFVPNEVFPVSYRQRRTAHLDVSGTRGAAIRRALQDQLGLAVKDVVPFGLAGSAGSTPVRIVLEGGPPAQLFGKLYAQSHLRADRWYKLGRELLYGRLEDEKPFNTVRRLVQQEDYALLLMQRAGLPTPRPYGFVELTPEREYLLVAEFFDEAVELGDAEVDDQVIDDGLQIIRKLWDAGVAHRDIKPANLLVRGGRLLLIDVAFVECRPTPWRQAVDLANMMLCLALRSNPGQVYERALARFSVAEIAEGFAAARGLALPSQLRRMLRAQGRDLHAEFISLLPAPPRPIRIQRWSARRVALWAGAALLLVLAATNWTAFANTQVATETPLYNNSVDCAELEPLWLMAQAVPSASSLPCVRSRLPGWTVGSVTVNSGRSVISLNHDRAGPGAVIIELLGACSPAVMTSMVERPAPAPGIRRFQQHEQSAGQYSTTWYDRVSGGCIVYHLQSTTDLQGRFATDLPQLLGFTTRDALQHALALRSHGRLQLDFRP